jgi:hypothetical protein
MKWRISIGAALAVALAASAVASLAQASSRSVRKNDATTVRDLAAELVGQVQVSAPGASPATSIQYGYLAQLGRLPIFNAQPPSESTALCTFYIDTTSRQVMNNGPIRVINREGTMTIYRDPAANGDFANRDSFRDGTRVLVARLQQQVIVNTAAGTFIAQNLNTVVSTRRFQGPGGVVQLGKAGDRFRTVISGHVNTPGASPSAFMAGYTCRVSEASKE